jgi:hypothetical protein
MRVDLQLPWFADGVHVDHYQKFALNGTYTIKTQ